MLSADHISITVSGYYSPPAARPAISAVTAAVIALRLQTSPASASAATKEELTIVTAVIAVGLLGLLGLLRLEIKSAAPAASESASTTPTPAHEEFSTWSIGWSACSIGRCASVRRSAARGRSRRCRNVVAGRGRWRRLSLSRVLKWGCRSPCTLSAACRLQSTDRRAIQHASPWQLLLLLELADRVPCRLSHDSILRNPCSDGLR